MKIISANERLQQQTGVKMAIFGQFGVGKTSLLKTPDEPTLCLDFEAGLLAVQD
jgi:ATPase subunit of ABC transporter with duplicated ATPase domains